MAIPLAGLAAAAGLVRGIAGIYGAKKRGNQQRDLIYQAYSRGKPRLDLRQHDQRADVGESLIARGLAGGGGIRDRGAAAPTPTDAGGGADTGISPFLAMGSSPSAIRTGMTQAPAVAPSGNSRGPLARLGRTGPRTLGEQQLVDLQHEQRLEQNELLAQRDAAVDNTRADGNQAVIDSIGAGINTGMQVYGAGKAWQASRGTPATPDQISSAGDIGRAYAGTMLPGVAGVGTIRGAYNIDPLNPVMPPPAPRGGITIGDGQPNYDFRKEIR